MPGPELKPSPLILVIDDDEDSRDLYATFLRFSGFRVETAVDGKEGLAKALHFRPAVVVMDLTMPRMSGLDLARRLKSDKRTRGTKIIVVTGAVLQRIAEEARGAGCDAFCIKPCLPETLLAEVRNQLAE